MRLKVLLSYVFLSKTTKPLPPCGLKMTILVTSKLIYIVVRDRSGTILATTNVQERRK